MNCLKCNKFIYKVYINQWKDRKRSHMVLSEYRYCTKCEMMYKFKAEAVRV